MPQTGTDGRESMIGSWRSGQNDHKSHPIIMSVDVSDNLDWRLSNHIKARFGEGPGPSGGGPEGPGGGGTGGPDGGPGGPDKGGPNKEGPGKGDGRPDNGSSDNGGPGKGGPDDGRLDNGPGIGGPPHEGQGGGNNIPPAEAPPPKAPPLGAAPPGTPPGQPAPLPTANNPDPIPSPSTPSINSIATVTTSSETQDQPASKTSVLVAISQTTSSSTTEDAATEAPDHISSSGPSGSYLTTLTTLTTVTILSPAMTFTTLTTIITPIPSTEAPNKVSMKTDTILGIVFGILSFFILLILLLFCLRKRQRKLAKKKANALYPYDDSIDYKRPGSFYFDAKRASDLYPESIVTWNESTIAPSDSISQAHVRSPSRRKPVSVAPPTELSALSEETERTDDSQTISSDASSTEVESLPAFGYGSNLKKAHEEQSDISENSSISSVTIRPQSGPENSNVPIITMTAPTPSSTLISGH